MSKQIDYNLGNVVFNNEYSTDELQIGVLDVNGTTKPLYQKTIVTTSISNYDLSSLNIDKMVYLGGIVYVGNLAYNIPYTYSTTYYITIYYESATKKIAEAKSSGISPSSYVVTIRYTKTTD